MLINALTIDVEDYYQVTNFEKQISRTDWPNYPSRVVANTHRILELLDQHQVKATFFVLGDIAHRHPQLVAEIVQGGHEVGSHSYWHRLVYELSPAEFRSDLRRSRDLLQEQSGGPVVAYRAPSFSITNQSLWALEILREEGFEVDSSVFPVRRHRYGIPTAPCTPYRLELPAGPLWEYPITVYRLANTWNLPIAGGGYFRLYPFPVTAKLLRRVNHQHAQPFVFYIHPWELDPDQPRLRCGSALQRFRHYVNLGSNTSKFARLLQMFRFGRLDEVLARHVEQAPAAVALTP
jgi:polysaccharide deacetylase family protein (PEP-CTERM system associated)